MKNIEIEELNVQELDQSEIESINGGCFIMVTSAIASIWGASFAIGYTAHFVYDQLK